MVFVLILSYEVNANNDTFKSFIVLYKHKNVIVIGTFNSCQTGAV